MRLRVVIAIATLSACDRAPPTQTQPTQTHAPTQPPPPSLTPSQPQTHAPSPKLPDAPFVSLPVAGFAPSLVAVPSRATPLLDPTLPDSTVPDSTLVIADSKRPVLVATHGHGESPDGICRVFRDLVKDRGYVLCLAGTRWPISGMHTYLSEGSLGEELDAAMSALHARFPDADLGSAVYAGFSMGATFGVAPLVERAKRFPRALMIEGGVTDWSVGRIQKYASGGGLRVLFVCGLRRRVALATEVAVTMRPYGLAADVVLGEDADGQEAGHTYYDGVATAVGDRFSWLVEGDVRWGSVPLTPR